MTRAIDDRRLRAALLVASVAMVVISVAVLISRAGGGDDAPPDRAAELVPRDTLLYVHLSTDRNREPVKDALDVARGFPAFGRIRDDLIARLGGTPTGTDGKDIGEWLGKEAAFAVLPTPGERSDVIVVLEVRDRDRAERYLRSRLTSPRGTTSVRGTTLTNQGTFWSAWVGDFLVLGSFNAVDRAITLHAGQGRRLADLEAYDRVTRDLPDDRVADVYARPAGLRGVLVPRGGLLGLAGSLADRQALVAVGAGLRPRDGGAQVTTKSLTAVGAPRIPEFEPTLLGSVPADSLAVVDTSAPGRVLPRVLGLAGGVGTVFQRFAAQLRRRSGVDLVGEITPLLARESLLSIRRGAPAPVFTLVARVRSEQAARERLARLQDPLTRSVAPAGRSSGQVPAFAVRRVGGVDVYELQIQPGLRVAYTVNRGRLIASTSIAGVQAALRTKKPIDEAEKFTDVLDKRPSTLTSLIFLDFSQLLGLGEQSGLAGEPGYARSRADLRKIQAIGIASSTEGNLTTAELFLETS